MEDTEQQVTQHPVVEQVTSKTPSTRQKNPKRVAAGKATAAKTKAAREEQKKAFIEAQSIIANNQAKPADPETTAEPPSAEPTKNVLTMTQWLSVISIIVSLVGLYYKREEIKNVFSKKSTPPSPVLPRATPQRAPPGKIRQMD